MKTRMHPEIGSSGLCQTIFCDQNEECVLQANTTIAICVCKDSCQKFASATDKVCTKDGQIFDNICSMNLASCQKKQK
uniref:Kazal-like domain-containing protein n=1 Tax=Romanomermis culicivorax TaxID=13658 RepID=A0A915J359_ROMCU